MNEFYDTVTYYGVGTIIRQYAGFPHFLPMPVSIQHGWKNVPTPFDVREDAPENWYWSVAIEQQHRVQFPKIATRTVGAPFLYLLKLLNYSPMPLTDQKGSIVFPSHSTPRIEMTCNFDEYADMLVELPEKYKPITVCLYYVDRDHGLDEPFLRKGFQVITNGSNRYEAHFLWNFVRNVHGKRFVFSNQMTSALLFASAMDLTAYFWGPEFSVDNNNPFWQQRDYNQYHRIWEERYQHVFRFPGNDLPTQKEVVTNELGVDHILTPHQMRRLLWRLTAHPKYVRQVKSAGFTYVRQSRAWEMARQVRATLSGTPN